VAGVLDLLFPRRCVVCRNPGDELCKACLAGLQRIPLPLCERCGAPTAWPVRRCGECAGRRLAFASARAAIVYDEAARALVRSWKERGLRGLAPVGAELVARAVARPDTVALCPVPPDPDRALTRGEHPATALARELGRRWNLLVVLPIARTAPRPRQAGLALADRRGNVRGTFRATRECPTSVCLVDDVYTTGETVNAAASALRKAGARRVYVVSLARAVR
jgi:predicted amidophosphoribosyltransferase